MAEEQKDRKIKERKYRGFHFNDDQLQTKEDGRKYIEIIEYEEMDLSGDCLEEIRNNIIVMNLRKKTEIVRGRSGTLITMKKKIKIIHKPFGAFLYADHVLQLNLNNKMANDKKIVKLVVNYDSNENKGEPKRSKNIQWNLRVIKGRPGPSCQLVCKIVIARKDTHFQVFQYRPVQLS